MEKTLRRSSTFDMKKMLLSKMSDNELGSMVKNMEKMIILSGGNFYGDGLIMTCQECIKRPYTNDVNILRVQDLMVGSFLRKNGIEESTIGEIINDKKQ